MILLRRSILLTLVAALAGCSGGEPQQLPGVPVEVGVVTLTAQNIPISAELIGRTTATLASDVRPQVNGIVMKRLFEQGSIVKQGQPLYQIDPRQYIASRDQIAAATESARATFAAAQAQVARYRALSDPDAVSRQQIDNAVATAGEARAAISQSEASLKAARLNLDYTLVRAPISGRIGRTAVTPGALVIANQVTALASIQQLDPIYVDIVQSADALLALRRSLANGSVLPSSAAVRLKLSDGSDYSQDGRIEFAEVTVDESAGTVALRARFPNAEGILLPGMFVRVEMPQAIVPNGILAPQQGITRDAKGNATALVVRADNTVIQRIVVTQQAIGDKWLVTNGLQPGDRLIVDGTDKVQPGATVKPVVAASGKAS